MGNTQILKLMQKNSKAEKAKNELRGQITEFMEMMKRKDDQLVEADNNKTNLEAKIEALENALEQQNKEMAKLQGKKQIKKALGLADADDEVTSPAVDDWMEEQM